MDRASSIGRIGARSRDDNPNILTPADEYNADHQGWKLMIQAKALKEHFGLEMIASLLAVVISVGGVIAYQSRTNGVTAASIDNLAEAQKQARAEVAKDLERQTKANNEAIARIETLVGKTVDVSQQNRDEMRSLRDSLERRIGLVEQKADSGWNWTVELKNRVGILEAERQQRKEK